MLTNTSHIQIFVHLLHLPTAALLKCEVCWR